MLKIENIEVTGWEAAIRGMRNPMNSWEKSDSGPGCRNDLCEGCPAGDCRSKPDRYWIGPNDLKLMKQLAKAGSVHAKYRRMINVTMDITAPLYYFKELDTYKVGTVCNSCSTMHKIQEKEFTLDDFSFEHLYGDTLPLIDCSSLPNLGPISPIVVLYGTINMLNAYRKLYLESHDKCYWWVMIQLLPSSYNQRRTYQFNYEVLSHIYFDRKDHKLDEWRTLCDTIKELPYADDIIIGEPKIKKVLNEEDAKSFTIKSNNVKFMEDGSVVIAGTKYVLEEKVKALESHIDTLVSMDD